MPPIRALAARAAREAGVPPDLYVALITRGERSYKGWQHSPAGASGPAQLMPGTAAALAERHGIDPSSYYGNLLGGAWYLREQLDRFKDPRLAVAAYNAGPGAVESHGGVPPYAETQRYVRNVLGGVGKPSNPPAPRAGGTSPPAVSLVAPPALDLSSQIFANLGEIASGRMSPLESLTSLNESLGTLHAPRLVDGRGHPTVMAARTPEPSGGWDGTQIPALKIANLGLAHGLQVTSTKRDRKLTSSGNPSDHWVGSKNAFAYDLGGNVDQMDAAAVRIAQRLGVRYKGGPLVLSKTVNGLRYQILYRTHIGGDHFNHIHIGVKRVG